MKKRVLIIGLQYHDKENIASVRISGLMKHLPAFGWAPTLVTLVNSPSTINQSMDQCDVIDVYHRNIFQRLLDFSHKNLESSSKQSSSSQNANNQPGLLSFIVANIYETDLFYFFMSKKFKKKIIELNHQYEFDAVISTSPLPIVHNMARAFSLKKKVPWIADLRDLWADNHYNDHGLLRSKVIRRREKSHLIHASALTTVSEPLADKLRQRYPDKRVVAIANGFDPSLVNENPEENIDQDCFSIVYTGTLYEGKRDPSLLFQAVRMALDRGRIDEKRIRIKFFGRKEERVSQIVSEYGLDDVVQFLGQVSREQSLLEQRKAQILLLLTWNNQEEAGVFTGKVFEYLAARRPIIHIGFVGGVVTDLLEETGSGNDFDSVEVLSDYLVASFQQFLEKGRVDLIQTDSTLCKYTHIQMAMSFSDLMETCIND